VTDRELLEQIAAQVGTLTKELAGVRTNMATMEANMATKDELAEIRANMATMGANMATKDELAEIRANMATKNELADVRADLTRVKEIVVRIENDNGQKLGALFDGYAQNADKLDRIEKIVARHDEDLLKKVK
jgi:regulator of replication initiation timing